MITQYPTLTLAGGYSREYPRNDVIITGLKEIGVEVDTRHVEWSSPFWRTRRLNTLLRKKPVSTDIVFVPSFCHHEVPVVRRHTKKPLFFDPLISRYESKINDYKTAARWSIHALSNYLADKRALNAADIVFADTQEHKKFFCEKYRIPEEKVKVLYVGYNAHDFSPEEKETKENGRIKVGFYGSFIPLHGIDVIIGAANILRKRSDILFELVGAGHTFDKIEKQIKSFGLKNVRLTGKVKYVQLPDKIRSWDICLGIFGSSKKTDMVIPNKVFHYSACGKPIITKKTKAVEEIFTNGKNIMLCESRPESLAGCIVRYVENSSLRRNMGKDAEFVIRNYDHTHTGRQVTDLMIESYRRQGNE